MIPLSSTGSLQQHEGIIGATIQMIVGWDTSKSYHKDYILVTSIFTALICFKSIFNRKVKIMYIACGIPNEY